MHIFLSIISLIITIIFYLITKKIYCRKRFFLLSPILTCPLLLLILISAGHIPYANYLSGAKWLSNMLGPATVAFAIPLHKHFDVLKKHALVIITSVIGGSLVAIISSMYLAFRLHLDRKIIESLVPRSVTTPIAMDISKSIGGVPNMTAAFVIITALTGIIIGPLIIRYLPVQGAIAKGVMFGTGAHGVGTSKAFEFGKLEGTISTLAMIIAAGATLLMAPWFIPLLH